MKLDGAFSPVVGALIHLFSVTSDNDYFFSLIMGTLFIHLLINFNFRRNSSTLPEDDFKCLYLATRLLTQIQR
ncbi:hypothetical protein NUKP82_52060 [Klebsiella variicola]|uniref:Uncharacterized protein n=1 Tax=Klebsiella variicola TaxID=244366 RepID=A0A9P0UTT0_KLEVA|nr:hypothetical protein CEO49_08380 [Klebsiella variicola]CAH5959710.1 hypothetical protein AN2335V1_0464 [Klebsiella variicola]SAW29141.1 Uncharacterised protein [Klebsiella variicola]SXF06397.1 Uncharacterised protein [Klebsiella variicola]VAS29667.1 Uncharacterised protein [Klebsiella variicola]